MVGGRLLAGTSTSCVCIQKAVSPCALKTSQPPFLYDSSRGDRFLKERAGRGWEGGTRKIGAPTVTHPRSLFLGQSISPPPPPPYSSPSGLLKSFPACLSTVLRPGAVSTLTRLPTLPCPSPRSLVPFLTLTTQPCHGIPPKLVRRGHSSFPSLLSLPPPLPGRLYLPRLPVQQQYSCSPIAGSSRDAVSRASPPLVVSTSRCPACLPTGSLRQIGRAHV